MSRPSVNGWSAGWRPLTRYVLALLATFAAVLVRRALDPVLGNSVPYISVFPAVIFSAWYCGIGPSLMSAAIALVAETYLYASPGPRGTLSASGVGVQIAMYVLVCAIVIMIAENNRRTIGRLNAANANLETRVQERTAALQRQAGELAHRSQLLDMANDAVFAVREGKITYWNRGAERMYGWTPEEAVGNEPGELLQSRLPVPREEIVQQLEREGSWSGNITQTRRDGVHILAASLWSAHRDDKGQPVGWLEINTDITQRKRAEESLRELTGRLLRLQDEERRRIARELHDSTGQMLVALGINLSGLAGEASKLPAHSGQILSDSQQLVQELTKEVRTLSYLLHPPLLDEAGLNSALRWYVEGFSKRSHVVVNLELSPAVGRLPRETETAIFRIVQECLTNVHRHSGSSFAEIRLERHPGGVRVEVQDEGKGIPAEKFQNTKLTSGLGIGITGMRERVRQLGGNLEIISDSQGTLIRADLPAAAAETK